MDVLLWHDAVARQDLGTAGDRERLVGRGAGGGRPGACQVLMAAPARKQSRGDTTHARPHARA
jgi:hypothetical protein